MSQSASPVRVKSGPPWWIWVILLLTTASVVVMIVLTSVPDDPEQLYAEAKAQIEKREDKGLEDKIARLRRQKGYEWHVKFLEGMQAFKQVRDPRALQLLAEIPDDHKLKPLALVKVGDSCQRSGKYKESMQAYEKAIALAPDATGGARVSLAGLYYSIGAFALAEKVLDDALQQDPEHRTAFETRGLVRFDQMRYSDALEDFQRVLSSPGQFAAASPRLLESYCRCIVKLGETELINEFAEEYLSLVDQQEVKLSVMNAAGQYDQVKSEISKNEGPEAGFLSVSKPALEAAVLTEDWTNAEQLLDKLLTILPRDIELFELAVKTYAGTQNAAKLAVAEENLKQLKELEASLLTAMQKVGEDIETADDRVAVARLFQELGRADAARIWFSVTATIDPTYADEAQEVLVGTTMPRKPLVEFSNDSEPASPADDAGKESIPNEKPADEKPADEKPADEKPADENPAGGEKANDAAEAGQTASGKTDPPEAKADEAE